MNKTKAGADYALRLCDSTSWSISASPQLHGFMEEFAGIMNMGRCTPLPDSSGEFGVNLLFTMTSPGDPAGRIIAQGRERDRRFLIFYEDPQRENILCHVKEWRTHDERYVAMWCALEPIFLNSVNKGGLPLHGMLAQKDGVGIVIAASGGTGKSTCAQRLPPPWRALCDDDLLVARDQGGRYQAHPFPTWSNFLERRPQKSWNVQHAAPPAAVFFLKQGTKDAVTRLRAAESALSLTEAARQSWQKFSNRTPKAELQAIRRTLFDNACTMAKHIPCYTLEATLHGKFWEEIERVV